MNKQVSLLKRGIAFIVDLYLGSLLQTLPISIITMFTLGKITQNVFILDKVTAMIAIGMGLLFMVFYYIVIPLKVMKGQTLGKRLMDIKVSYNQPSTLIKRQIIYMIALTSFGTLLGQFLSVMLNYNIIEIANDVTMSISVVSIVMIFVNKQHMALHDRIAKTHIMNLK